jgi:ABC-type glucose/galactose transport system permease subunit
LALLLFDSQSPWVFVLLSIIGLVLFTSFIYCLAWMGVNPVTRRDW